MADSFNPDAYLAQKASAPTSFDPDQYLAQKSPETPGLLGQAWNMAKTTGSQLGGFALDKAVQLGKAVDSYTGAPVRSGISALQDGKDLQGAVDAYKNQFGSDSDLAPTGKDIATKAGFDNTKSMSDRYPDLYTSEPGLTLKAKKGGLLDFTPAGAAGAAVDVAADPMMAAGGVLKAAKLIPGIGEAIEGTKALAGKAALATGSKVGEALTGVPSEEIKTYVQNLKEINQNISKYGKRLSDASDDVRANFAADIKQTRQSLNSQIGGALEKADPNLRIPLDPILNRLEAGKNGLNPHLKADEISQIDDLMGKIQNVADEKNTIGVKDAFDVKNFLQDAAYPSYQKSGQIFVPGNSTARAAKNAASDARNLLNTASPQIAEANNQLSKLHEVEKNINKNLIAPGKNQSALMGAGASADNRNAKNLKDLGKLTGTDMVGEAKKLAAQRQFTSPGLMPVDSTGKSATRVGVGAGLGYLIGHAPGAVVGSAMTSPAALKAGINTGASIGKIPFPALYGAGLLGARSSQNKQR